MKKCWGQPAAANVIFDKQGVRNGRLWQSPIFARGHFNRELLGGLERETIGGSIELRK